MGTSESDPAVRIGCGSAYSRDPAHAAVTVVEEGNVEYLCCDRLAERTLATATKAKLQDCAPGYNPLLEEWFEEVLPASTEHGVTIVGNFGAANPEAAGERVTELAQEMGFDLTVATITGDSVVDELAHHDLTNLNTGEPLRPEELPGEVVSANAYLGAEPIVEALNGGADVVIGGRIGDHSLYLGTLLHEFEGGMEADLDTLAAWSTVGHLLECGIHATGGNFATPGYVEVPGLERLGLPLAEVQPDGTAVLSKPDGTGGVVSELSVASQLIYEVHDPGNYKTPDVTVDLRDVTLEQVDPDAVRIDGARGKPEPDQLKVLVGVDEGYMAEIEIGWGGRDALTKANLTKETIEPIIREVQDEVEDIRVDRIGVDAIHGAAAPDPECNPNEVRLRVALQTDQAERAERILDRLEPQMFFSANGGGGLARSVEPYVGIYPTLLPRSAVEPEVRFIATTQEEVEA